VDGGEKGKGKQEEERREEQKKKEGIENP